MIVRLSGVLLEKTPTCIVLDVQGIGYQVFVSLGTYDRLPPTATACVLHIYHHIREDGQQLFGFHQPTEKRMFELLLGISGIGPKLALNVLSGLTVQELSVAIADNNVKRISSVNGVGKKTAERIALELRDKIDPLEALGAKTPDAAAPGSAILRDTLLALTSLGFPQDQARKMAQTAWDANPGTTDTEALLKAALSRR